MYYYFMQRGKLIIISGPSAGVGKDTVIKMFLAKHRDWHMPPSVTTREPRLGEIDGKDMKFVQRAVFEKWQKENKFLESVLVDNNQWYGTLREPVEELLKQGKNIILRKDVQGALIIKKTMPETILVFMNAENWESLEKRIKSRATEDEKAVQRKLALAKTELPYQEKYDHVIINPTGHPEQALKSLEKIIWHS